MAAVTPLTIKTPTDEEAEFILAIQKFKEENNKKFPTWSEAFRVLKSLGYAKVQAEPQEQPEPDPKPELAKPKKPRKSRSKKNA